MWRRIQMLRHAPVRSLIWTLGWVLWLIVCYRGFQYLSAQEREHDTAPFIATRTLPPNSRLVESDLTRNPALPFWHASSSAAHAAGKYLIATGDRPIGASVWMSELHAQPKVDAESKAMLKLVPLKEQPELAQSLNAGHRVGLCAKTCATDVLVEFIWCADSNDCFAAMQLDQQQTTFLDTDETLRVFLQR
jgi:hypothetical protein